LEHLQVPALRIHLEERLIAGPGQLREEIVKSADYDPFDMVDISVVAKFAQGVSVGLMERAEDSRVGDIDLALAVFGPESYVQRLPEFVTECSLLQSFIVRCNRFE
jgi:hypothetical protein